MLALEHVEDLVLALVDVERSVGKRRHLFEQRERAARRLRGGPDEDGHVTEDEKLAAVLFAGKRRNRRHSPRIDARAS